MVQDTNKRPAFDSHMKKYDKTAPAGDRIKHLKEVISLDSPPERCYEPVPLGVQGNYTLSTGCSYCDYKNICWKGANNGSGLRVFQYSNSLKYFTHVEVEPRVEEITNEL